MKDVRQVLLEAAAIEPDVQTRIVCPFCQGGSTSERCMSIIRTMAGEIKYICHRAKCGMAGRNNSPSLDVASKPQPPRQPQPVRLRELSQAECDRIYSRWLIPANRARACRWMWDEISDRLAIPVISPSGVMRGLVLRALSETQVPKVLNVQWVFEEPFIGWYQFGNNSCGKTVVVEDLPSAVRVNSCNSDLKVVALNGTHIGDNTIQELYKCCDKNCVILALDEDASVKALEYARSLNPILGRVSVILLTKDFKNMTNKEISECLRNVI